MIEIIIKSLQSPTTRPTRVSVATTPIQESQRIEAALRQLSKKLYITKNIIYKKRNDIRELILILWVSTLSLCILYNFWISGNKQFIYAYTFTIIRLRVRPKFKVKTTHILSSHLKLFNVQVTLLQKHEMKIHI